MVVSKVDKVDSYGVDVSIIEAQHLARSGYYADAVNILDSCLKNKKCTESEYYDLMAKISGQQGNPLAAYKFWTKAIEHDPSNQTYRIALESVEHSIRKQGSGRSILGRFPYFLVCALLMVTAVNFLMISWTKKSLSRDLEGVRLQSATSDDRLSQKVSEVSKYVAALPSGKTVDSIGEKLDKKADAVTVSNQLSTLSELTKNVVISLGKQQSKKYLDQQKQITEISNELKFIHKKLDSIVGKSRR
jgi:tetratricopeptide (TPR) repeat protein